MSLPMLSVSLTSKQAIAAKALANGLTIKEVAKLAGVSKRTVLRWKKIDAFQTELNQAKHLVATNSIEIIRESKESILRDYREEISSMIDLSLSLLKEVMKNPEETTRSRLKAAEIFGNWMGLKYMNEVNMAIELLEKRGFKVVVENLEHLVNETN
ncbi:MAG: LacI family DNA-binding transcriptional regulator [Symploca sp. SIO1B1]|nr:LacI family DNA-binding transcriptional regulator [Symploca sp. SIO1B1]